MRLSLAGNEVDWMMKTSSPRTFSWISTKISMSAKRCTVALVSSTRIEAAMASASGRLLLPAISFMARSPGGGWVLRCGTVSTNSLPARKRGVTAP